MYIKPYELLLWCFCHFWSLTGSYSHSLSFYGEEQHKILPSVFHITLCAPRRKESQVWNDMKAEF